MALTATPRQRRSKAMPAKDQVLAVEIAPAGDRARDLRDLTSFVNRVLAWPTPAAAAAPEVA